MNKIEQFISEWNLKYPFDYVWRKKYGIPFGSKQHLRMNHIDMIIDLAESAQIQRLIDKSDKDEMEELMSAPISDILTSDRQLPSKQAVKMTQEEIDKEFADLDITKY